MVFWITIYIIILFFSFYSNKNITLKLLWIFLGFLSAFRYNVGTDYHSYKDMYIAYQTNNIPRIWELKEPLFTNLIKLLNLYNFNYQTLFIVTSIMIVTLFYKSSMKLYKAKDERYFYLFLFFPILYLVSLNVIRQFIAIAIFSYIIYYLIQNKPFKYFIGVIIAVFFHYSAIILLPIVFIYNLVLKKWHIILIFIVIIIFLLFNFIGIVQIVLNYFHIRYAYYLNGIIQTKEFSTVVIFFVKLVVSIILISLLDKKDRFNNILFNVTLYFLLLNSLVYYSNIASRLVFYFNFIYILLILQLYRQYKYELQFYTKRLLYIGTICLMSFYLMYSSYFREVKDEAYAQYSVNFDFIGKGYPMEIYDARK